MCLILKSGRTQAREAIALRVQLTRCKHRTLTFVMQSAVKMCATLHFVARANTIRSSYFNSAFLGSTITSNLEAHTHANLFGAS
jgi:hypothetical protein